MVIKNDMAAIKKARREIKDRTTNVRFSAEMMAQIRAEADRHAIAVSTWVRMACAEKLRRG